jgi:hypothetical protein
MGAGPLTNIDEPRRAGRIIRSRVLIDPSNWVGKQHSNRKPLCVSVVLLVLTAHLMVLAQPTPLQTLANHPLWLPAADLTTNGIPGLTNVTPNLMVSAITSTSARGGKVSLVITQLWVRTYSGVSGYSGYSDSPARVIVDFRGNVCVAGGSYQPGTGADFATVKYGVDGVALWTNRYDGPAHLDDAVRFLAADGSRNVFSAGNSIGATNGADIALVKYSAAGLPLWTNRYTTASTNYDDLTGLAVDATGNSYLTVHTAVPGGAPSAYVTLKFDWEGNAVWTNLYKASTDGPDFTIGPVVDGKGNVFVSGTSYGGPVFGGGMSGFNFATLKYSSDGTCLWTNRYTRAGDDLARALVADPMGDVIVAGESWGGYSNLYAVVKYSNAGLPVWTNLLAGPNYSGGYTLLSTDGSGDVYFAGGSPGASAPNDMSVVKLTREGTPVWTNRLVRSDNGERPIVALAVDSAGGCYVAGYAAQPGNGSWDYFTVKYGSDGTPAWTNWYDGVAHSDDMAFDATVDGAGNLYVTGESAGIGTGYDFGTVKYADYLLYQPPADFAGEDTVAFTVVDRFGNSAAAAVTITVMPPLRFNLSPDHFGFEPQGMRLQVDGASDSSPVLLYASPDLMIWEPVLTNSSAQGSVQFLDRTAANYARRFYRAEQR